MTDSIAADDVAGATVAPEIVGIDGVTTQAANGTAHPEDTAAPAAATEVSPPENPMLTKLQEIWAEVQDSDDFSTWASLVSTAEKLDDLHQLRKAYDAFLEHYPLCYGYWKKYAEAEKRHAADSAAADATAAAAAGSSSTGGSVESAAAAYQRGVAAVPHSAELWVAYAALLQGSDAPSDTVRSVYEAAAAAVGSDYTSGLLWDKYLAYEATQGVPSAVAALYARALKCPVKDLDKYHTGLTNYASSRTAAELLPDDTIAALKAHLEQQAEAEAQAAAAAAAAAAAVAAEEQQQQQQGEDADMQAAAADGAAADTAAAGTDETAATAAAAAAGQAGGSEAEGTGDVEMAEAPAADATAAEATVADAAAADTTDLAAAGGDEQPAAADATAAGAGQGTAAAPAAAAAEAAVTQPAAVDDAAIKAAWLAQQEAAYQATKQQLAAISGFESGIRRPYWHHKTLDGAQLQNWVAYLDWQQQKGDVEATQRLYERCLVPCANYPEFWIRYVLWCEAHPDSSSSSSTPAAEAPAVLARAVGTFCRKHPGLAIFAARFHEGRGDVAAAREQYQQLVTNLAPGLIEAIVAYANFEHRTAGPSAAQAVYGQALASSKEQQQEKESKAGGSSGSNGSSSSSRGFLYVVYANFLRQVVGDLDAARVVLQSGLALHPECKELWEGALWFEETLPGSDRVERVLALYDQLLKPKAAAVAKQQQQQDGSTSSDQPPAAAAAAAAAAPEDGSSAAAEEAGKDLENPTAAAAAAGVLQDDTLEEFSQRCVEFADMYADLKTLQGVHKRHLQLFPLPAAAIAAKQRDAAAAGSATVAAAANGYVKPDAGAAAGAAAAAAAAAAADHAAYGAAAAGGYYPPPPGGYYPPSHYPPHGGYGPPHHYGPPPPHYGHHYGYGGYGGY